MPQIHDIHQKLLVYWAWLGVFWDSHSTIFHDWATLLHLVECPVTECGKNRLPLETLWTWKSPFELSRPALLLFHDYLRIKINFLYIMLQLYQIRFIRTFRWPFVNVFVNLIWHKNFCAFLELAFKISNIQLTFLLLTEEPSRAHHVIWLYLAIFWKKTCLN